MGYGCAHAIVLSKIKEALGLDQVQKSVEEKRRKEKSRVEQRRVERSREEISVICGLLPFNTFSFHSFHDLFSALPLQTFRLWLSSSLKTFTLTVLSSFHLLLFSPPFLSLPISFIILIIYLLSCPYFSTAVPTSPMSPTLLLLFFFCPFSHLFVQVKGAFTAAAPISVDTLNYFASLDIPVYEVRTVRSRNFSSSIINLRNRHTFDTSPFNINLTHVHPLSPSPCYS